MPLPAPDRIYLPMRKLMKFLLACLAVVAFCSALAAAQTEPREEPPKLSQPNTNPLQPPAKPSEPQVSFDWVTAGDQPQEFSVTVDSTGRAALEITGRNSPDATPAGVPFIVRFTMPERDRERIFQLAESANFFQGSFDYTRNRVANTGPKTLTYADARRRFSTTYNWSENKAIQELTGLFSGIYWTEYFGRKLQQQQHYDKLGLNDTLLAMDGSAKRGDLTELQLVQPVLQSIAEDGSVMNIARMRARQLLERIPAAAAPATAGSHRQ